MSIQGWTFLIATSMLVLAGEMRAQQPASNPQRSTRMGVYTREQWMRGRDVYAGMCAACHQAVSHVGPAFTVSWAGKKLSELFGYIKEQMPKNDPGAFRGAVRGRHHAFSAERMPSAVTNCRWTVALRTGSQWRVFH